MYSYEASQTHLGLFSAIAAGNGFTLALRIDGTVACWRYQYSQWDGSSADFGSCNLPAGLSNIVLIAAGWFHGIAVTANGDVFVWGSYVSTDSDGKSTLLIGSAYSTFFDKSYGKVVAIAGGAGHSLMLLDSGKVISWGPGTSYSQQSIPVSIQLGGWARATAISTNLNNNIALLDDGTVLVWGDNAHGQLNVIPNLPYVSIVAAGMGQYAVAGARFLYSWGQVYTNNSRHAWYDSDGHATSVTAGWFSTFLLFDSGFIDEVGSVSVYLQGFSSVMAVASGPTHMVALSGCGPAPPSPPPLPPPTPPQPPPSPRRELIPSCVCVQVWQVGQMFCIPWNRSLLSVASSCLVVI